MENGGARIVLTLWLLVLVGLLFYDTFRMFITRVMVNKLEEAAAKQYCHLFNLMRKKSDNLSQNLSNNGRTSRRNIKMPNRYKDSVCELNKNKNNEKRSIETEHEELLDNMGLNKNGAEIGNMEVNKCSVSEVELTGSGFPTLDESMGKERAGEKVSNVNTDAASDQSEGSTMEGNNVHCDDTNNVNPSVSNPETQISVTASDADKIHDSCDVNDCNGTGHTETKVGKSYAETAKPTKVDVLNKLSWIPTVLNEGREVVIAIASSLGTPIMMDKSTARMCDEGTGNIGYARVLVEIKAAHDFKEKIELCYKSRELMICCYKFVKVEYSWKPPRCSVCKVFGHLDCNCALNKVEVNTTTTKHVQDENNGNKGSLKQVTNMGNKGGNKNVRKRQEFRPVEKGQTHVASKFVAITSSNSVASTSTLGQKSTPKTTNPVHQKTPQNTSPKSPWKVSKNTLDEIKRSANKYAVLEDLVESDCPEEQWKYGQEIVNK
ncbi:ATPase, F1/V1/A1 complex, alpha/beta subunit, Zinc knuckle CX2CX4HX4C [Artemisia annua]|uniref:ATPase, F1/V1/A1 complex, alpha/beta subunit, Zinc knuckle CX2CX4HX4C n=1 Tax=Artemisia annua TaxID=35608 RepID=A0A2U1P3I3_ARTAN|nr:ATPase, F1/V1/A1 complex, alpha/beta subunit, Zinc knuckle CX2CX4HX4C [Artemisia annua]